MRSTTRQRQRCILISLAVLAVFLIPYTLGWSWGWWKFVTVSTIIVLLWRWARPRAFAVDLGIRLRPRGFVIAILTLLVVGVGAHLLIPRILGHYGYVRDSTNFTWMCLAIPFQTLNEEMVLRALLLTGLGYFIKRRLALSLGVAASFALLHFVLYKFGPPHTELSISALMTLLLIGFALNELFLATGCIAIPWAIHFGWNLTRFGHDWIGQDGQTYLEDGIDFNLIEGNPWVIALGVGLALSVLAARSRNNPPLGNSALMA